MDDLVCQTSVKDLFQVEILFRLHFSSTKDRTHDHKYTKNT